MKIDPHKKQHAASDCACTADSAFTAVQHLSLFCWPFMRTIYVTCMPSRITLVEGPDGRVGVFEGTYRSWRNLRPVHLRRSYRFCMRIVASRLRCSWRSTLQSLIGFA